jgi:hypothetical protein
VKLAKVQTRRVMRALAALPDGAKESASSFLTAMIDADDRAHVERLVYGAEVTRR